jgi:ribonucleoside-diphosphate reductase alpha subunit
MGKQMQVVKRDGRLEAVSFDKITARISNLVDGLLPVLDNVDAAMLGQKVIRHVHHGVTTVELDEQTAVTAAAMSTVHPDYDALAGRVCVSNNHKNTPKTFLESVRAQMANVDAGGASVPLLADWVSEVAEANADAIEAAIDYDRDFTLTYFGFKTLERGYLARAMSPAQAMASGGGAIPVERPQHMWMRVAIGIHGADLAAAFETYDLMSRGCFTHATPTLFNSGTAHPQNSSCFLMKVPEDSIKGIYKALGWCADISKYAGGIGISVHGVRARGSRIRGTNGVSTGLVPMLRNFNATARYVNQGSKRNGSFAIYLEPWHPDVEEFLELRKNHGDEESRCRDLFLSLWVPDLFMRRVEAGEQWSLFCPDECPGLDAAHGEAFDRLYESYEAAGRARRTMPAAKLMRLIVTSQIETGTPYMISKDQANAKSNQGHLGTISSSNLCAEIVQYTSPDEIAVCNLASVCLPAFVGLPPRSGETCSTGHGGANDGDTGPWGPTPAARYGSGTFDFAGMARVARVIVRNLNRIIDANMYPVEEARNSNLRHRPVGVGVQGLADVFARLRLPFDSDDARLLNRHIFECLYFACVDASAELAEELGPYPTFPGSPASRGVLQYGLWGRRPGDDGGWLLPAAAWESLEDRVRERGMRNSLLTALMPTASTSQIMGNAESFEPFHGMVAKRSTLAGEFKQVNRYLVADLQALGLWGEAIKQRIVQNRGSVQGVPEIPAEVQRLYRTVWEIKQTPIIQMAADRGIFVDQSQSMNLYLAEPNMNSLTQMIFKCYKAGLKTWVYYTRVMPGAHAQQVSVMPEVAIEAARGREAAAKAAAAATKDAAAAAKDAAAAAKAKDAAAAATKDSAPAASKDSAPAVTDAPTDPAGAESFVAEAKAAAPAPAATDDPIFCPIGGGSGCDACGA